MADYSARTIMHIPLWHHSSDYGAQKVEYPMCTEESLLERIPELVEQGFCPDMLCDALVEE